MPMDLTLRPMSTAQVLDRTFQLYRNNFLLFAGIAALPPGLILLAKLLGAASVPFLSRFSSSGAVIGVVLGGGAFVILYLAGSTLATGATAFAVSRVHLASAVSISDSYKAVGPLILRILGITLLVALMAGGAFLAGYLVFGVPIFFFGAVVRGGGPSLTFAVALVGFLALAAASVWAIRIYCRYSLAVPACVVEQLPVTSSLRRSKFLSTESLFRIFLIYLLLVILAITLSVVLSIPTFLVTAAAPGNSFLLIMIWDWIANFLAATLVGPMGTIAIALVYYDQRVRKEAFDLQLMMQALGQQPPPQSSSAAAPGIG
jgi:hypothetical protein